jgi:hypothetical protein
VLCACAAGCEAQAGEGYLGEPLLELHGSAIVTAETGGEAVSPALCFLKRAPLLLPPSVESLPEDVRQVLAEPIAFGLASNAVADEAAFVAPRLVEIVDVESVGHFPAEFNVEAYLPPSDEFTQPLFAGEPPIAEGYLCAVREGHPDVVNRPDSLFAQRCENGNDGPCETHRAFLSRDSDAYFLETSRCPTSNALSDECERTTRGDVVVRRNTLGSFIEGKADPLVVYLAEPAKPGSYTAWKYASPEGLSAGFHLFQDPVWGRSAASTPPKLDSCKLASNDAYEQIRREMATRYYSITVEPGVLLDNIELDPVLRDAYHRRAAELQMERCPLPDAPPVSHTESLEVRFVNESSLQPSNALNEWKPTP